MSNGNVGRGVGQRKTQEEDEERPCIDGSRCMSLCRSAQTDSDRPRTVWQRPESWTNLQHRSLRAQWRFLSQIQWRSLRTAVACSGLSLRLSTTGKRAHSGIARAVLALKAT